MSKSIDKIEFYSTCIRFIELKESKKQKKNACALPSFLN